MRYDLSRPWDRLRARLHLELVDHGILRHLWTNEAEIAPGVWRSNQPGPARFRRLRARGISSVLTLRGPSDSAPNMIERAQCAKLGLTLEVAKLSARSAPQRENLQELLAIFRRIEKPFVMHCKSGADRAGLASALYLMVIEKRSLQEARAQLSFRFLHLKQTKTGILDLILDLFEDAQAHGPVDFETWLATGYDADQANQLFASGRRAR